MSCIDFIISVDLHDMQGSVNCNQINLSDDYINLTYNDIEHILKVEDKANENIIASINNTYLTHYKTDYQSNTPGAIFSYVNQGQFEQLSTLFSDLDRFTVVGIEKEGNNKDINFINMDYCQFVQCPDQCAKVVEIKDSLEPTSTS